MKKPFGSMLWPSSKMAIFWIPGGIVYIVCWLYAIHSSRILFIPGGFVFCMAWMAFGAHVLHPIWSKAWIKAMNDQIKKDNEPKS